MASVKEWETKQWYLFADLIYRHTENILWKKKLINQFKKPGKLFQLVENREIINNFSPELKKRPAFGYDLFPSFPKEAQEVIGWNRLIWKLKVKQRYQIYCVKN